MELFISYCVGERTRRTAVDGEESHDRQTEVSVMVAVVGSPLSTYCSLLSRSRYGQHTTQTNRELKAHIRHIPLPVWVFLVIVTLLPSDYAVMVDYEIIQAGGPLVITSLLWLHSGTGGSSDNILNRPVRSFTGFTDHHCNVDFCFQQQLECELTHSRQWPGDFSVGF